MFLDSFPLALAAGTCLGILSGLGIGGGSLLILWLTLVLHLDPGLSRGISLLFFFPASLLGALGKKAPIPGGRILPAALVGMITAAAFSRLSLVIDPEKLRKAMGILLLIIGTAEIFHRKKK